MGCSITARSPTRTRERASSPSAAPMSIQSWSTRSCLSLSSGSVRCGAFWPTTPATGPSLREHADALGDEHRGHPAADAAEPEEALVVDVGDDQADLVDVSEHRHRPLAAGVHGGVAGPQSVAADVGEAGRVPAPDLRGLALVARRARGLEELSEEGV